MIRIAIAAGLALALAGTASAQVAVRGYTRSDGTYVPPHVRSSPNSTTADNWGGYRTPAAPSYTPPRPAYTAPQPSTACSGYGCYGQPSSANGRPRTDIVSGYTRSDGTYVSPYTRSPR